MTFSVRLTNQMLLLNVKFSYFLSISLYPQILVAVPVILCWVFYV